MEDALPFGSGEYFVFLGILLFGRGMDLFSTWLATPNLVLEANPIARKLGWRWGIPVNLALCAWLAQLPVPAVMIATTSVLVAAHNFKVAWLMRDAGEHNYRAWMADRLDQVPLGLFLLSLLGETGLTALVGVAVAWAGGDENFLTLGLGFGIVGYAGAVLIFTLLAVWRTKRTLGREADFREGDQ